MRVVLDSNVLVAAFGTHGLCEAVLAVCIASHELVSSEPILADVAERLISKFKVPKAQARENVAFLREHADVVEPEQVPRDACRDPDDVVVLGTVAAGHAERLVTGDKDLLVLRRFRDVPILSPRAFYDSLR